MSAYTPGPWSVITLDDGFQFIANDETKVTVCLAPELPLHNGVKAWPDNARLIAGAPGLLGACQTLESLIPLLRMITIRQVLAAGDAAIEAAGLNPYCVSEGLATGDEPAIGLWKLERIVEAIAKATKP